MKYAIISCSLIHYVFGSLPNQLTKNYFYVRFACKENYKFQNWANANCVRSSISSSYYYTSICLQLNLLKARTLRLATMLNNANNTKHAFLNLLTT